MPSLLGYPRHSPTFQSTNMSSPQDFSEKSSAEGSSADPHNHATAGGIMAEPGTQQAGPAPKKRRAGVMPSTNQGTDAAQLEKAGTPDSGDDDDVIFLTEDDAYEELGFCFPTWKKWTILTGTITGRLAL